MSPISPLSERIDGAVVAAMKAREPLRLGTLRMVRAALKNREIDSREELTEDGALQVVAKAIKQRKDASEQMRSAGRPELADQEDEQAAILQGYLPQQLSEAEVRSMVREIVGAGSAPMGAVMGQLMPRIRGRFDGKEANRIVKEELGG